MTNCEDKQCFPFPHKECKGCKYIGMQKTTEGTYCFPVCSAPAPPKLPEKCPNFEPKQEQEADDGIDGACYFIDEKMYCFECGKEFDDIDQLKKHVGTCGEKKQEQEEKGHCSTCGRELTRVGLRMVCWVCKKPQGVCTCSPVNAKKQPKQELDADDLRGQLLMIQRVKDNIAIELNNIQGHVDEGLEKLKGLEGVKNE